MDNLNERQKRFIDFYIQTGNASESAKRAGYSKNHAKVIGCKLLTNVNIKRALDKRLAELESARTADTKEVLEYMSSVMRGETVEEVVVNVGIGKGYTEPKKVLAKAGAKERLKAAELLAKVHGCFVTKSEINLDSNVPIVITGQDKILD